MKPAVWSIDYWLESTRSSRSSEHNIIVAILVNCLLYLANYWLIQQKKRAYSIFVFIEGYNFCTSSIHRYDDDNNFWSNSTSLECWSSLAKHLTQCSNINKGALFASINELSACHHSDASVYLNFGISNSQLKYFNKTKETATLPSFGCNPMIGNLVFVLTNFSFQHFTSKLPPGLSTDSVFTTLSERKVFRSAKL